MPTSHVVSGVRTPSVGGAPPSIVLESPSEGTTGGTALYVRGRLAPGLEADHVSASTWREIATLPVQRVGDRLVVEGWIDLLGRGLDLDIKLRVPGVERPLAGIKVSRTVDPQPDDGLRPLSVTSMGRSGSTWLMRLLLSHPSIVGYETYPFEARVIPHALAIRAAMLSSVVRAGDPGVPSRIEDLVNAKASAADNAARSIIRGFYSASSHAGAMYVAEKGAMPRQTRELFHGSREIYLTRDPRDMFASMLAFNRKRGFNSFGREAVESDAEFADAFVGQVRAFLTAQRLDQPGTLAVQYESLITSPEATLARILSHLGLDDLSPQALLEIAQSDDDDQLAAHRTTSDPSASIGRWRDSLPPDLLDRLTEGLGDLLDPWA